MGMLLEGGASADGSAGGGTASVDEGSSSIRVVLVDDHEMFTESLARILTSEPDIEIVGIGGTGAEAARLAAARRPDVVVLDYHLPDDDAPPITAAILDACPTARVLILSGTGDDRSLIAALQAGCAGFVTKDKAVGELVTAVRQVHAGEPYIPASMLAALLPHVGQRDGRVGADLTAREREVLSCLSDGMSNSAIAERLFLSVHTVRNHIQGVLAKLNAHSKLEAVAIATREGLLDQLR
ncbi:MAG: LuxR C-terminal-related transcriptional regulator [Acidimicrobiales bacterium]